MALVQLVVVAALVLTPPSLGQFGLGASMIAAVVGAYAAMIVGGFVILHVVPNALVRLSCAVKNQLAPGESRRLMYVENKDGLRWLPMGTFWNGLAIFGVALSSLGAAVAGEHGDAADFSIYAAPQRLVEVEPGRKLNLVCVGEGSPTVVFDVGVGDPSGDWSLVQPQVAKLTRACSYDRAGIGFSDPSASHGSSAEIVADMARMLAAASIEPPYVLVGQSYGGMNVRLYYYLHPEQVIGLVLVEPAHEDQDEGFRMLSPRGLSRAEWVATREPGRVSRQRCIEAATHGAIRKDDTDCIVSPPATLPDAVKPLWLSMQFTAKFQRAQGAEEQAVFNESVDQLRTHRRGFGSLPVIVLSRSAEEGPLRAWETRRLRDARYQLWLDLHRSLADSSSRGEWRIVPKSDHMLMLSQPQAVVTAVRDVLAAAAADKP